MNLYSHIERTISEARSKPFRILNRVPVGGGSISEAERIEGEDARYFVKKNHSSFLVHFEEEKDALEELAATGIVRVPQPICTGANSNESYLVLEFISIGSPRERSWERLGQQLAELHRLPKSSFGWKRDNTIGGTEQINTVSNDWIEFFREHRLEFQIDLARKNRFHLEGAPDLLNGFPLLFEGYTPRPSLLHGDLWSGNAAFDERGDPFLFDPCCYCGDREADLAFTSFFGGFHPA